jgi:hypothetical protein
MPDVAGSSPAERTMDSSAAAVAQAGTSAFLVRTRTPVRSRAVAPCGLSLSWQSVGAKSKVRRFDARQPLQALLGQRQSQRVQTACIRVRVPGRVPMESDPARVPGLAANECAVCRREIRVLRSPRGWLTEQARCPAGNRRSRREPRARSSPAPSALRHPLRRGKPSVGRRRRSRKPPSTQVPCGSEPHSLRSWMRNGHDPAGRRGLPDQQV